MKHLPHMVTIRFSTVDDQSYRLDLEGPQEGERRSHFALSLAAGKMVVEAVG
jgi:hypothetical protein